MERAWFICMEAGGKQQAYKYNEKVQKLRDNIAKVIVGKETTVTMLLTAMIAGGHVLLEDMPGTGKTLLAKTLAKSIASSFQRVQFTPDLLPSDITGLNIYHQKESDFVFHKGPVFCNVLLADEINRATPRTQASLLECMEEKQVTVDGVTRKLEAPFFVIATQNPIETAGTFPLPEAQLDRFIMKLSMEQVSAEEEMGILKRFMEGNPYRELESVCTGEDIIALQKMAAGIYVHQELLAYIQSISQATRQKKDIVAGVSPRGTLALLRCVQAYALLQGRTYAVPEDIKEVAVNTLAHRIVLQGGFGNTRVHRDKIQEILQTVAVPTEDWSK